MNYEKDLFHRLGTNHDKILIHYYRFKDNKIIGGSIQKQSSLLNNAYNKYVDDKIDSLADMILDPRLTPSEIRNAYLANLVTQEEKSLIPDDAKPVTLEYDTVNDNIAVENVFNKHYSVSDDYHEEDLTKLDRFNGELLVVMPSYSSSNLGDNVTYKFYLRDKGYTVSLVIFFEEIKVKGNVYLVPTHNQNMLASIYNNLDNIDKYPVYRNKTVMSPLLKNVVYVFEYCSYKNYKNTRYCYVFNEKVIDVLIGMGVVDDHNNLTLSNITGAKYYSYDKKKSTVRHNTVPTNIVVKK